MRSVWLCSSTWEQTSTNRYINRYTCMSIHIQNVHNYIQIHIMVRIQCCYLHVHNYISFQTLTTQATALHIASRSNYLDIASQLLIAGAKLDLKDSDGKVYRYMYSILHCACTFLQSYTLRISYELLSSSCFSCRCGDACTCMCMFESHPRKLIFLPLSLTYMYTYM